MKRLTLILVTIIALLGCRASIRTAPEVIYLCDGEEFTGRLERITVDSIWFSGQDTSLALPKTDVRGIDIPQPRQGDEWQTVADVTDPIAKRILKDFVPPQSDAKFVDLYVEHNIILNDDGTCTKTMRVIRYVNAESGKGSAANSVWGYLADRSYARVDFARSYSPDGSVTHINETAINRVSRFPAPAEYSNLMHIQIAVPESRVGSILDFQFSIVQNVVDSIHPVYRSYVFEFSTEPTLEEVVRMVQPVGGALDYHTTDMPEPRREVKRGREILTWTVENQMPQRQEYNTPPAQDYLPHLIIATKQSWHDIAAHLRGHLELACRSDTVLGVVVDSLTRDLISDDDRAQALYEFVAEDIRNVGPSPNYYSYAPTPVDKILQRRFANNLDRAALLYAMISLAGLETDLVFIRSSSSGELASSFPALGQLNYALVLYNNRTYLDPLPNTPFGTLYQQDARGLSITTGKLKETPLNQPREEATWTHTYARLRFNGSLDLTMKVETNGQNSAAWKRYLLNLTPEEIRQEAEELAAWIHPNARLIDYEFTGAEPLDENVSYTLTVNVADYATRAGDYLIFYLPGIKHSAYQVGAADRLAPIDRDIRSEDRIELELELPSGAEIVYRPRDITLINTYDSYEAEFGDGEPGRLIFTETAMVLMPVIPPEDYPLYKELILGMARLSQEPIILRF